MVKKNQKILSNFLLKREILKTIKANQVINYIISLKNNLKIKK